MRTYGEWKDRGYAVIRGEKAVSRLEGISGISGVCLFDRSQVTKVPRPYKGTYKVVVSESAGYRFGEVIKTKEKVRDGYRLLCRCATKEDADIVVSGLQDSQRNLMW